MLHSSFVLLNANSSNLLNPPSFKFHLQPTYCSDHYLPFIQYLNFELHKVDCMLIRTFSVEEMITVAGDKRSQNELTQDVKYTALMKLEREVPNKMTLKG